MDFHTFEPKHSHERTKYLTKKYNTKRIRNTYTLIDTLSSINKLVIWINGLREINTNETIKAELIKSKTKIMLLSCMAESKEVRKISESSWLCISRIKCSKKTFRQDMLKFESAL